MISFKKASIQDLDAITTLVNSAYRGEYSKKGWTTEADILGGQRTDSDALKEIILMPNNQIELMYHDGKVIGSIHLRVEKPATLYFGMLTIEPSLQAQGLGRKLLEHVDKLAKTMGLTQIRISVIHTRKELIAYYERRGFRATGNFEDFPENDPKFGQPKISGLKLLEFVKLL